MTDNVTNELILEHLKQIQTKLGSMDARLVTMEEEARAHRTITTGLMQSQNAQSGSVAEMQLRLDRIERRLELTES